MKYWFIQHNMQAYIDHPNMIGQEHEGKISKVKKGDKLVYYVMGDKVVVGTFRVTSNILKLKNDTSWGDIWAYKIKPIKLEKKPFFLPLNEVLSKNKLKLFSHNKIEGIKLRGRTAIELTKKDFNMIESFIGKYTPPKNLFNEITNEEGLGEPKELCIMRYTPTNEMGVVVLFAQYMQELGFSHFEFIRPGFPDACVFEKKEGRLHKRYIEFEFKSSQFRQHINNPKHVKIRCDYVVCWEDDFPTCPIKVIELKSRIEKLIQK